MTEEYHAQGDNVRGNKLELNVETVTAEDLELFHRLLEMQERLPVQFEPPTQEEMAQADFSLLVWKLEKGGFSDQDFIEMVKEQSVMADVATTKLSTRSAAVRNELTSLQVKLKSWFVRTVYLHLQPGDGQGNSFIQTVDSKIPDFVSNQQNTLTKIVIDQENVWGLIWLLTSKCKVKWHRDER